MKEKNFLKAISKKIGICLLAASVVGGMIPASPVKAAPTNLTITNDPFEDLLDSPVHRYYNGSTWSSSNPPSATTGTYNAYWTPIKSIIDRISADKGKYSYTDANGNTETGTITPDMCTIVTASKNTVVAPCVDYTGGSFVPMGNRVVALPANTVITDGGYCVDEWSENEYNYFYDTNTFVEGTHYYVRFLLESTMNGLYPGGVGTKGNTSLDSIINNVVLGEGSYILRVTKGTGNNTAQFDFPFTISHISRIDWPEKLTNTTYYAGQEWDVSKDHITVSYANRQSRSVPVTKDMIYLAATDGLGVVYSYLANSPYSAAMANTPYDSYRCVLKYGAYGSWGTAITDVNPVYPSNAVYYSKPYFYDVKVLNKSGILPEVKYQAHVQNVGWQGFTYSPYSAGTEGQSKRMEAIVIDIENKTPDFGGLEYQVHVQNKGWMDPATTGKIAGTTGESLRMEAIKLSFTGKYADIYDIYYRTHVQTIGWTEWVKNGAVSGTEGQSKRLEAIQIKVSLK